MASTRRSNDNLQTASVDPAFRSNERLKTRSSPQRRLNDCCYSISNLALIVASIVAIIFTAKFLNDDPLYEVGDYLLTLKFYRQLIYVIVILPLTLLVPLFNASSAFFLTGYYSKDSGRSLILVRIFYQILMVILLLIALIFVGPNVKGSLVSSQVDFELKKHMYARYNNGFSYEFLDRIQFEYKCCDRLYYGLNFNGKLPISCYRDPPVFSMPFDLTCSYVIGNMVSNRCIVITICLIILLICLLSLILMDTLELMSKSTQNKQYELKINNSNQSQLLAGNNHYTSAKTLMGRANDENDNDPNLNNRIDQLNKLLDNRSSDFDLDDSSSDGILSATDISNRLKLSEREREPPLLTPKPKFISKPSSPSHSTDPYNKTNLNKVLPPIPNIKPILTRANYLSGERTFRSQSPIFIHRSNNNLNTDDEQTAVLTTSPTSLLPTKSLLKKSTSSISEKGLGADEDDSDNEVQNYQRELQRELSTRRSLLSVRFAE